MKEAAQAQASRFSDAIFGLLAPDNKYRHHVKSINRSTQMIQLNDGTKIPFADILAEDDLTSLRTQAHSLIKNLLEPPITAENWFREMMSETQTQQFYRGVLLCKNAVLESAIIYALSRSIQNKHRDRLL